jgi:hypothetical protein
MYTNLKITDINHCVIFLTRLLIQLYKKTAYTVLKRSSNWKSHNIFDNFMLVWVVWGSSAWYLNHKTILRSKFSSAV